MRADEWDGMPGTGETGRYLGVRPNVDVPVGEDGSVEPRAGGMSGVPPPVTNLARHRLPHELGGTGRDPVFELETGELSGELVYRPDPDSPGEHGFIEPSRRMSFEGYRRAIHGTRGLWHRLPGGVR
jgi:hypothetical protein